MQSPTDLRLVSLRSTGTIPPPHAEDASAIFSVTMPDSRPPITGTEHPLPFDQLDPRAFERLCLGLLQREGYDPVDDLGAAGADGGVDLVAWQQGLPTAVQCKRVKSFPKGEAKAAVEKILAEPLPVPAEAILVMVACAVRRDAREAAQTAAGTTIPCKIWAMGELDDRVKGHADLVDRFFQAGRGAAPAVRAEHRSVAAGGDIAGQVSTGDGAFQVGDHANFSGATIQVGRPDEPSPLALAPSPPPKFTGREEILDEIQRRLRKGGSHALTALHGLGGIGKTAIAQELAHRLLPQFPGGVLWWELGPEPDAETALAVWAQAVGLDLSAYPSLEARQSLLRNALARRGALCAILDDAWHTDAARALLRALPDGCPLLVTTRLVEVARAMGCEPLDLDVLGEAEARALLAKLVGGPLKAVAGSVDALLRLTGCLPLALELAAGLVDGPDELPEIVASLQEKPRLETLRTFDALPGDPRRDSSVEACFALSYAALGKEDQRRFRALGVFAEAPFDAAAVGAVWGEDKEVPPTLRREDALLRQHALLRAYARALLQIEGETDRAAERHAEHYQQLAKQQPWQGVEIAYEQIRHGWAWVQANKREAVLPFVDAIQRFQKSRGRWSELLEWLSVAQQAARETKARTDEGTTLNNIGSVYSALGQKQQALETYKNALEIRREVGDRGGEGTTLNNIGLVYDALGQKQQALETYKNALEILREVGDRGGEAVTLFNIGSVLEFLGHIAEAVEALEACVALDEAVGHPDLESDRAVLEQLRAKLAE